MPPNTSATTRLNNDKVLVLVTALASRPPMPADWAASAGTCPAALEDSPKPVITTKA